MLINHPGAAQVRFLAFLAEPEEGSAVQTLTLMLRYVASSMLPAPLYSVAVDMDVHPHLAAPTKVRLCCCYTLDGKFHAVSALLDPGIWHGRCKSVVLRHRAGCAVVGRQTVFPVKSTTTSVS